MHINAGISDFSHVYVFCYFQSVSFYSVQKMAIIIFIYFIYNLFIFLLFYFRIITQLKIHLPHNAHVQRAHSSNVNNQKEVPT